MKIGNEDNTEALTTIVGALKGLDKELQQRTLHAVATFFGIPWSNSESGQFNKITVSNANEGSVKHNDVTFSQNRDISAKEFLREKAPHTDVERIACLAYYLTHYKSSPHFKTLDLSALNTEAAQPKFSNSTYAVNNAITGGFLVPASKGTNQLSAAGEVFVQALPDREAARAQMSSLRGKKRAKKGSQKNGNPN